MRCYWLNAYFPEALGRAIDQMPSGRRLQRAFDRAKLRIVTREPWFVPTDPVDLFLYAGKNNPNLYLNARVRQGISTFAKLADPQEVARGLVRLKHDVASGAIARVMARYASNAGRLPIRCRPVRAEIGSTLPSSSYLGQRSAPI
jgi:hypothetical protein